MESVAHRNELARKRYHARKEQRNKEFLERILNDEPLPEVAVIIHDLLGSGNYKTMDYRTRRMLFPLENFAFKRGI
jgi:hypothetical protein